MQRLAALQEEFAEEVRRREMAASPQPRSEEAAPAPGEAQEQRASS
jgi:hypothetical protein